ncbi:hypothetical protein IF650_05850 [Cellulosimicrobium terreum]|nr:hypothetical protein [Cellulosimicrobium terreum]
MTTTTDQVARGVRASLLASTSLAVAAVAHSSAAGHVPGGAGLLLLGVLTVALSVLVSRARANVLVLVPFLVLLQVVLHHGFMLLAATPGSGASTSMAGHHPFTTADAGRLVGAAAQHAEDPHGVGPGMLAAHAVAVVVTAAVLVASERAARLALAMWTWILPVLAGVVMPVRGAESPSAPRAEEFGCASDRAARSVAPRRGPPAGSLVVA